MGCSVCGELPLRCRGFCNKHYIAWRRYGDPLGAKFTHSKNPVGTYAYIVENIVETPGPIETPCWIWQKALSENGYGVFGDTDRATVYSHRRMFELNSGSSADGWFVCHRCDESRCCNPDHLFLGTAIENNDDMVVKGRDRKDRHLLKEEVLSIKSRLDLGETPKEIAKDFHVNVRHIRDIKQGRTYNEI